MPETDDTSLPTLTPRVLILGTVLCIFGASISQLFFFKSNAPSFSSFFIILVSYPLGKWFDKLLPVSLQRGPFGKKEHMLVSRGTEPNHPFHSAPAEAMQDFSDADRNPRRVRCVRSLRR